MGRHKISPAAANQYDVLYDLLSYCPDIELASRARSVLSKLTLQTTIRRCKEHLKQQDEETRQKRKEYYKKYYQENKDAYKERSKNNRPTSLD